MGMFSDWLKKDEPKGLEGARQRILGEDEEMIARELPEIIKKRRAGKNATTAAKKQLGGQGISVSGKGDDVSVKHPSNWKGGDQLADAGIATQQGNRKLRGPDNEDGTPFSPETTPGPELRQNLGLSPRTSMTPATKSLDEIPDHHESVREGLLSERQQMLSDYRKKLRESFDLEDSMVDEQILPLRNSIQEILKNQIGESDGSQEGMRDQFISLMALSNTYDGRIRNGEGKRSVFFEDAQQLLNPSVQKMLIDGYGDGSPEQIKKFVNSRKVVDTPMDIVEQLYSTLPKAFVQALGSGNLGETFKALQEDGTIKNIAAKKLHFGGADARVGSGDKKRKLLLLKLFLDQAGRDGYTGNPLDPRYMELEHVRGINALGDGESAPTEEQLLQRENVDNWLWIATGVNNEKSDLHMPEFIDRIKDKYTGKGKEDFVDLEAGDEAYRERQTGLQSVIEGLVKDNAFTDGATPELVQSLFDNELEESKLMGRNGIKKTPVELADKIRKALGFPKDRKLTRSQVKTKKELFRPLIMHMLSLPPEQRADVVSNYSELFHAAGDRTAELSGMGEAGLSEPDVLTKKDGTFNESGTWGKMFYKSLVDAGLITKESLQQNLQPGEFKALSKIMFEGAELEKWLDTTGRFVI